MTETLNYDPVDPNAPEFNEAEEEALEIAEELSQEEAALYAGKYENAEQLEQAYLELQKKLGSDDDDVEVDALDEDEDESELSPGVELIANASAEYYENDGSLSEETMQAFGEMSSQELVQAFMDIQEANPDFQNTDSSDLTDAEMETIYN